MKLRKFTSKRGIKSYKLTNKQIEELTLNRPITINDIDIEKIEINKSLIFFQLGIGYNLVENNAKDDYWLVSNCINNKNVCRENYYKESEIKEIIKETLQCPISIQNDSGYLKGYVTPFRTVELS